MTIKAHYLANQAKDLEAQRKESQVKATSGIMSLGLDVENSSKSSASSSVQQ